MADVIYASRCNVCGVYDETHEGTLPDGWAWAILCFEDGSTFCRPVCAKTACLLRALAWMSLDAKLDLEAGPHAPQDRLAPTSNLPKVRKKRRPLSVVREVGQKKP